MSALELVNTSFLPATPRLPGDTIPVQKPAEPDNRQFEAALQRTAGAEKTTSLSSPVARPDLNKPYSEPPNRAAEKSLETLLVSQFLKPFFQEYSKAMFDGSLAGDIYSSLYSDAVAEVIANGKGIGLVKLD